MDDKTIEALNRINCSFYEEVGESFSSTRRYAWRGWDRALDIVEADASVSRNVLDDGSRPYRVLDAACGNMRFERYLIQRHPHQSFSFCLIDARVAPMDSDEGLVCLECDIVEALQEGNGLPAGVRTGSFDLVVSMAFMHHIPSERLRISFLREMLSCLRAGGYAIVSLWRFMADDRIALKARSMMDHLRQNINTAQAFDLDIDMLEPNDYLIGWQDHPTAIRYCHHFPESEVKALTKSVEDLCMLVYSFQADGKNNDLNWYLIFKRS